jgi:hypothetical protein
LNGTVPLLPCPCRGREEEDFKSFSPLTLSFSTSLLASLLTQPIPSLMKKQETHAPHHDEKKVMPCSGCTGPIPRHHALHLNRYGDPLPRHSINIREDYRTGGMIFGQKTEGRVCLRGEELGQNRKKRKEQGKTGKMQKRKKGKPEGAKFWRRREGQ